MKSQLIIRTCHHVLPEGRHCRGAAVHGRSCCRHHLEARTRLHNMARAQRRTLILRLCVPNSHRDLALNRAEVSRVVASGRVDFETARMLFRAMNLTAQSLRAELISHQNRARNPNVSYYVAANPLFAKLYIENPSQIVENKNQQGEGVSHAKRERLNAKC